MTYIDTTKLQVLEAGVLLNGRDYEVVLLKPEHAQLVTDMHNETIDGLTDDQKEFMLPKSKAFFEEHLKGDNGSAVIAVVSYGQLMAQAAIHHPTGDWSKTGMVDMAQVADTDKTSIMQAVSVSPAHRGVGLMNILVYNWPHYAEAQGRTDLMAEIDTRNIASWSVFIKGGLDLHSMGTDPADGVVVYNAHEKAGLAKKKALSPIFNAQARPNLQVLDRFDIHGQKSMFGKGYKAVGFNKFDDVLFFEKDDGLPVDATMLHKPKP